MSEENVGLVQRAWQQFLSTGEIPRELIHDDVEYHWHPDIPDTQIYRGPDGLVKALREWQQNWEQTEYEVSEMTDLGDHVLVGFRERATGRGGIAVDKEWFQLYTIRAGKLAMLRELSTREEALEAAGLSK